jgi:hypothetical protein
MPLDKSPPASESAMAREEDESQEIDIGNEGEPGFS